jgi:hypothetical protein
MSRQSLQGCREIVGTSGDIMDVSDNIVDNCVVKSIAPEFVKHIGLHSFNLGLDRLREPCGMPQSVVTLCRQRQR